MSFLCTMSTSAKQGPLLIQILLEKKKEVEGKGYYLIKLIKKTQNIQMSFTVRQQHFETWLCSLSITGTD